MEINEDFVCKYCNEVIYEPEFNIRYCPFCGKEQYEKFEEEIVLNEGMEEKVYEWLSRRLSIDKWLVSETVKNQVATIFLLVWPILETELFKGDMSHTQMKDVAKRVKENIKISEIEHIARHFYERYQDFDKYYKLASNGTRRWDRVERLLNRAYEDIYKQSKIEFLIYVVYRYRNNIFHGLKSLKAWNDFSEEIMLCIEFMIILGDAMGDSKKEVD